MLDIFVVRVGQGLANLNSHLGDLFLRQQALLVQDLLQRLPVHELHGEIVVSALLPGGLAGIDEFDDVGVIQPLGIAAFPLETGQVLLILLEFPQKDLDGNFPAGGKLGGLVDDAHGPLAELGLQLEVPDLSDLLLGLLVLSLIFVPNRQQHPLELGRLGHVQQAQLLGRLIDQRIFTPLLGGLMSFIDLLGLIGVDEFGFNRGQQEIDIGSGRHSARRNTKSGKTKKDTVSVILGPPAPGHHNSPSEPRQRRTGTED